MEELKSIYRYYLNDFKASHYKSEEYERDLNILIGMEIVLKHLGIELEEDRI